jgi:hypothetical protein
MEMKCKNANVIACDRSDLLPKTGTEKDGKTMKKKTFTKQLPLNLCLQHPGHWMSLDVTGPPERCTADSL